jgi:hypothetical protein
VVERRQPWQRQRRPPEPGHGVQPHEDQRADPRRQQAGEQHQPERGPAQPGGFHQQERADDRGAEQGADRGEATGRRDHRTDLLGHLAMGETHRAHAESGAEGDQRRLRPEYRSQAEAREGREQHARQVDGTRLRSCRETVDR